jgi:hypothetical protein
MTSHPVASVKSGPQSRVACSVVGVKNRMSWKPGGVDRWMGGNGMGRAVGVIWIVSATAGRDWDLGLC